MNAVLAPVLAVVAGVLLDGDGRVLLAQRPEGKHLAGLWEFPGGKHEPGESSVVALRRELEEELGIRIDDATPLLGVPWRYDDTPLLLEALRVSGWQGEVQPREGQALRWIKPAVVDARTLAPADRPILTALRLPAQYPITPEGSRDAARPMRRESDCAPLLLPLLRGALARGETLLQLRLPSRPPAVARALAGQCLPMLHAAHASLLLNGDIEGARRLGPGVGVHLRAAQLRTVATRPLPPGHWVGASCHDAEDLELAQRVGADFAVLGPVRITASHADAPALGWERFAELVTAAALPVYALGGMTPADTDHARAAGAQGVAGITAFWP
jgi:8-oxo-dGTP diphosphatase